MTPGAGFAPRKLGVADLTALFRGVEHLRRPYPALMSRLRGLGTAQAFLDGSLIRGATAPGRPPTPGGGGESPGTGERAEEGIPDLEPALTERILVSLLAVGSTAAEAPSREAAPAHPPSRQAIIDGIRRRLAA